MESLNRIKEIKDGNFSKLNSERWLMHLMFTGEKNINRERIGSMTELEENYLLEYVEKSLLILDKNCKNSGDKEIIEEVLKWAECAKGGMAHQRRIWLANGYNLFVHNEGSAKIYIEETAEIEENKKLIISELIATHGLLGQYIRGEVPFESNYSLYRLIEKNLITNERLKKILILLNKSVIGAVSEEIEKKTQEEIADGIDKIVNGNFGERVEIKERIRKLRTASIKNGENFDEEYSKVVNEKVSPKIGELIEKRDLWYVEAALYDFSLEEFIKIFGLVYSSIEGKNIGHISFEHIMKDIYYQYEGKKKINIYKKRIIGKYLSEITLEEAFEGKVKENMHVNFVGKKEENINDTIFAAFKFSAAGEKLIEFCIEAEKSGVLYEKAIVILFDLFNLRKDKYDRFNEEESYLATMNQSIDYKKIILDYICGEKVIDIGPGGGGIMDLIEERFPDKKVTGVDISQNVIDTLTKKKNIEGKKWDVIYGDALNLSQYVGEESIDTIIFCSIIHELYSYIEFNGVKFNKETIYAALQSAFKALKGGGRIIIRDGIMTEPENQTRIIKFLSNDGVQFLERYAADFKGREIKYEITGHNEVKMGVNDAMEFLYTYTWGEKSYVHEVNEQFGYFTPSGYIKFIKESLGERAEIVTEKHFLQEGYEIALSGKIEIMDEARNRVKLPDSTVLIVVEKKK